MKLRLLTLSLLASTALPVATIAQTTTPGAEASKPTAQQTQRAQRARRAPPLRRPLLRLPQQRPAATRVRKPA